MEILDHTGLTHLYEKIKGLFVSRAYVDNYRNNKWIPYNAHGVVNVGNILPPDKILKILFYKNVSTTEGQYTWVLIDEFVTPLPLNQMPLRVWDSGSNGFYSISASIALNSSYAVTSKSLTNIGGTNGSADFQVRMYYKSPERT